MSGTVDGTRLELAHGMRIESAGRTWTTYFDKGGSSHKGGLLDPRRALVTAGRTILDGASNAAIYRACGMVHGTLVKLRAVIEKAERRRRQSRESSLRYKRKNLDKVRRQNRECKRVARREHTERVRAAERDRDRSAWRADYRPIENARARERYTPESGLDKRRREKLRILTQRKAA